MIQNRGRPKDPTWQEYDRVESDGVSRCRCKKCGTFVKADLYDIKIHLARRCTEVSEEERVVWVRTVPKSRRTKSEVALIRTLPDEADEEHDGHDKFSGTPRSAGGMASRRVPGIPVMAEMGHIDSMHGGVPVGLPVSMPIGLPVAVAGGLPAGGLPVQAVGMSAATSGTVAGDLHAPAPSALAIATSGGLPSGSSVVSAGGAMTASGAMAASLGDGSGGDAGGDAGGIVAGVPVGASVISAPLLGRMHAAGHLQRQRGAGGTGLGVDHGRVSEAELSAWDAIALTFYQCHIPWYSIREPVMREMFRRINPGFRLPEPEYLAERITRIDFASENAKRAAPTTPQDFSPRVRQRV